MDYPDACLIGRNALESAQVRLKQLESKVAYVEIRTDELSTLLSTMSQSIALLQRALFELPEGREKDAIAEFVCEFENMVLNPTPLGECPSSLKDTPA